MLPIYIFVLLIHARISLSYMVLPFDNRYESPGSRPNNYNLRNVGEPLILTPYLQRNQTLKARELSTVQSLLKDENIVSNAGFFTVDEENKSNLFFWFFQKYGSDWNAAPVILWLNGGPGLSSMDGLFDENGPYIFTKHGLEKRNYSWTYDYNVIYIDQPVGTGFSFTNPSGKINTQEKVGEHLYEALTQFFQLYPELKYNEFYISGESYAGRYIPAIGYKIHSMKKTDSTDINLKGLFMISAFTEGLYDGLADFCFKIGIIDSKIRTLLQEYEQMIRANVSAGNWKQASESIYTTLGTIGRNSKIDYYDYTKLNRDGLGRYVSFLTQSSIRKKIHVGNLEYERSNHTIQSDFYEDVSKSVVSWVEELVEHYPVAFVSGQFDVIVAYPLVVNVMQKLKWSGAADYKAAQRNIFNEDKVDGYIKVAGNLKDVLIRNAGHMVPRDQSRATLDLLNKFINGEL